MASEPTTQIVETISPIFGRLTLDSIGVDSANTEIQYIEIQSLQVSVECAGAGVWGRRRREVEVGLHDDFFIRDIRDQHACCVGEALNVVKFHRRGTVGEDIFLVQGLEDVTLRPFLRRVERKSIGFQGPNPCPQNFLIVGFVAVMSDHGCALVDERAESTQMVPVMVCRHDKSDRLVWNESIQFVYHRQ